MEDNQRVIRVLFVDDDPDEHIIFKELLAEADPLGYLCETVETSKAAEARQKIQAYDIIFVDNRLSTADSFGSGGAFLRALVNRGIQVPVVLVTGETSVTVDEAVLDLINRGLIFFLEKSELAPEKVHALIQELLQVEVRVLHIEDDEDDALIVESYLEEASPYRFNLTRAANLEEARKLWNPENFDVVLSDWNLGTETGFAFIEEVLAESAEVPVVLLTSSKEIYLHRGALRLIGHCRLGFMSKSGMTTQALVDAILAQRTRVLTPTRTRPSPLRLG